MVKDYKQRNKFFSELLFLFILFYFFVFDSGNIKIEKKKQQFSSNNIQLFTAFPTALIAEVH